MLGSVIATATRPSTRSRCVTASASPKTSAAAAWGTSSSTRRADRDRAGVTITSRQFSGGDPLAGPSTANSGDITLTSPDIEVGNSARLLAHATGAFQAGQITLAATLTIAPTWVLGLQGFQIAQANTSIDIGADAILKAGGVSITTTATTNKSASLTQPLLPGAENELAQLVDLVGLPDLSGLSLPISAAAVFSNAVSTIHVGAGARIDAIDR